MRIPRSKIDLKNDQLINLYSSLPKLWEELQEYKNAAAYQMKVA